MKYKELIAQMTLEEKASLMSGENFWNTKAVQRLGVPSMMLTDGPHGVRKQGGKADHLGLHKSLPATCFPTAATLANSWDTQLLQQVGACLGTEAAAEDISVLLGPGLNIKRSPLCGRNFEYFSEDPFLTGKLAASMIQGIQSKGVSACPKHYAVNSQEERRMVIDEVVDERTLREIYLEGFRYAVQEGKAKSLMTSYNRVNGSYANENIPLLQDILTEEWGFRGLIVTDWGGENDRIEGLLAGNGLEMPSTAGASDQQIVQAVKSGQINESLLDQRVNTLLEVLYDTQPAKGKGKHFTDEEHHQAARRAARESIVLLKNEHNLLPLPAASRIAVIGDFAQTPRYQGAGSSLINPTRIDNLLTCLQAEDLIITGYAPGFKRLGGKSRGRLNRAVELAKTADIALLFLGLDEGSEAEGIDRSHMKLRESQTELLAKVRGVCSKIIVVLCGGSPVEMPWLPLADAVVHTYLGGQAGAPALADVLMGRYNPSGKLAESYPLRGSDVSCAPWYPGLQMTAEHRESLYVGYRYFDTAAKEVLFPFGFGLSYTSFEYSGLKIHSNSITFTIRNTGLTAGAEIAQVYVAKPNSGVFRCQKELKGFAKVFLQPEEQQQVTIELDDHAFAYYNTAAARWVVESGEYELLVGASSRDIRLRETVHQNGEETPLPYAEKTLPSYFSADVHKVSDEEFSALLGRPLPASQWDASKPLDYNDTIAQGRYKKGFGRFLYRLVRLARRVCLWAGRPIAANNVMFVINLPFRALSRLTGGVLDDAMAAALLVMVNGQFFKGLGALIRAAVQKRKRKKQKAQMQTDT